VTIRVRLASLTLLAVGLLSGMAARAQTGGQIGDPGQEGGPPAAMGNARGVRGTVTAVAGDKVTLKTENGDVYKVAVTANTRLLKERQPIKIADVKVGDGIGAMGEVDPAPKTVHALFVSVVSAEEIKKMKESLGKTWISGKVTAIDETKLTILRTDKVSQTIEVDEDTSFKRGGRGLQMAMQGEPGQMGGGGRRDGASGGSGTGGPPNGGPPDGGGESITLGDVKVGDNVVGQGALKNGTFVPTTLAVVTPGQRRRRDQGDAPAGAPAVPPPNTGATVGPK
jgi:hypothetical protein